MSDREPANRRQYRPRKDKYAKTRRGSIRLYTIMCAACRQPVLLYQKDGPGALLRLYLDRILAPPALADMHERCASKSDVPNLVCAHCGNVIAVPMVYAKEKRLAFRLIKGRWFKQRSTGLFPPA
ncbi:MAG: hypothetical protein JXJ20_15045 [Anaerolineae bacterium]|nr:hypothetical protein [Anaerolineae bacterium]